MFSETKLRLVKTSQSARVIIFTFAVLGIVIEGVGFTSPFLLTAQDSIEKFLNQRGFAITCVPLFLVILYFGFSSYGPFERARSSTQKEFQSNIWWLFLCALAVTVLSLVTWIAIEFGFGHRDWSQAKEQLPGILLLMFISSCTQLIAIGLFQYMLISFGLSWGKTMPVLMVALISANWVLNGWAPDFTSLIFYFLIPVEPTFSSLAINKLIPFASFCILLTFVCGWAYDNRDYLGS
ncbi:hypothetical protein [Bombiscardovia apis]|uniref:hypothetical protein n=1 Tax=Bombiscardovia apis TaxID=2932182 RepID=UPI002954F0DC|nr:hypothetical protein [Bombiscardovia apis]